MSHHTSGICLSVLAAAMLAPPASAQLRDPAAVKPDSWCQTAVHWQKKGLDGMPSLTGLCRLEGDCDFSSIREQFIPDGTGPTLVVRVKINVLREDDGSNPASTVALVGDQMTQLNADFAPHQVQFLLMDVSFIDDSTYRTLNPDDDVAVAAMKTAYADSPDTQCNVYVTTLTGGVLGFATFPWDPDALAAQGGIVMDGASFGTGQKTLTHEMGHALGLWHTHRNDELEECSSCYEEPGDPSAADRGDFCADTPPTPTNFTCDDPPGLDPCSDLPWAPTQPENYMSYAPDSCYSLFTSQQAGRLHCWSINLLGTWLEPICPGDFDGSGAVDIVDLLDLLAAWGSSDPTYDIAPAGGDGTVDIQDLLGLLATWGGCP
jgi:hypothetical protein